MSTLGNRTVLLRKALGLTQKEFGKAGNLSQSNLSLMENDGVFTSVEFFINIKENFPNINLNWWIAGQGEIFLSKSAVLDVPPGMDPGIAKFLSDVRDQLSNIQTTNRIIRPKKKKD